MEIYNRLPDDIRHKMFRHFKHPNAVSIQTIPKDIDISIDQNYYYKYKLGEVLDDKPIHTKLKALGRRRISWEILRGQSAMTNPLLTAMRLLHRVKFKTIVSNLTNEYNELENYLQKKHKFDLSDGKIQSQLVKYYKYIEYYEKQLVNLFSGFALTFNTLYTNLVGRMSGVELIDSRSFRFYQCCLNHYKHFKQNIDATQQKKHSSIKTKKYKKTHTNHSKKHKRYYRGGFNTSPFYLR